MRYLLDTLGAVYELARLGMISGFRVRGAYWSWRTSTAFGRGYPEHRREAIGAVLEYGRWVHRMRRGL
ncbi:MAG TPA: hypothetical protein PKE29_11115 [Phycisphaerales bacterium]|nr:hypothetical protein [Phycisphaerales bacterium]